jgi:hypothetical protein
MKTENGSTSCFSHVRPMVVFLLGVLAGVLITGFIFLYQTLNSNDYQSAILKKSPKIQNQQLQTTPKAAVPTVPQNKSYKLNPDSYGEVSPIPSP